MTWVVAARCDVQKCDQNATINAGGVIVLTFNNNVHCIEISDTLILLFTAEDFVYRNIGHQLLVILFSRTVVRKGLKRRKESKMKSDRP